MFEQVVWDFSIFVGGTPPIQIESILQSLIATAPIQMLGYLEQIIGMNIRYTMTVK